MIRRLLKMVLPPVIVMVVVLSFWQLATVAFDIPAFILPAPTDVVAAATKILPKLLPATWLTAQAALCGLALSILAGTFAACVFSQSDFLRSGCYPYAIFLQTVPIIAIAPLVIISCGRGFHSVVIVSWMISLFPIITNTTIGLLSVDRDLLDLFRLNNATRWQTLFRLRLPTALPFLFAGARIACGGAVVGAIVGEFFIGYQGNSPGLGSMIRQKFDLQRADELFATVIASTLLGVFVFAATSLISDWLLRHRSGSK